MAITMKYDKPTALRIRDFLIKQGLTIEGAYGMMANIYSESGFRSNNAQNSCMARLGMTDEIYVAKVDSGEYKDFATDRVGFGLCQWTSAGRKTGLLSYAKEQKKSIADETMQLNYLMKELKASYKTVFNVITTSHDVSECAKYVMTKFERPANQSQENQSRRASYGIQLFNDLEKNRGEQNKMTYTNSPLITYTRISPNRTSPRNHIIDTITIHCYVGEVTAERGCNGSRFVNYDATNGASCNYVVGYDGSVGLCVPESDRSWCSSNKANDHRAITIEVACEPVKPHKVTDIAMNTLIKLVADICKRNSIEKLKWSTNKSDRVNHKNGCNMTVHRDFKNKDCPGEYLYNNHSYIASEVNKLLGVKESTQTPIAPTTSNTTYTKTQFIKDIQSAIGAKVDGIAGQETLSKTVTVSKTKNNRHAVIKPIQKYLNAQGFSCGTADGVAGTKFDLAVKAYQKANGCVADGEITARKNTWKKLLGM